jgi:hypothetical protein
MMKAISLRSLILYELLQLIVISATVIANVWGADSIRVRLTLSSGPVRLGLLARSKSCPRRMPR